MPDSALPRGTTPMASGPKDPSISRAAASIPQVAPDYFARLAQLAVPSPDVPTLVPRIASRFEPGAAGDARDAAGLREVEAWVAAGDVSTDGWVGAGTVSAPSSRERSSGHEGHVPRSPRGGVDAVGDVGSPSKLIDGRPSVRADVLEQSPQVTRPGAQPPMNDGDASRPQATPAATLPAPMIRESTPPASGSENAAGQTTAFARVPALGPIERLDPPAARRVPEAAASASVASAAGERGSVPAQAALRSDTRPPPVAPPPIEIHIDRIEVRGIVPAAAPAPVYVAAPPARLPTGLDELLRRRRGEPA